MTAELTRTSDGWRPGALGRGLAALVRRGGSARRSRDLDARSEALAERERLYRSIVGNLPGIVFRCDVAGGWVDTYISEGALALTGYTAEELVGPHGHTLERIVHPDDVAECDALAEAAIAERRGYRCRYRIVRADGAVRWVDETSSPLLDARGEVSFLDGVIIDVTDAVRAEEARRELARELERLAYHDDLTGLVSRARFHELAAAVLDVDAAAGADTALLYVDLDRFSTVNNTLGHAAGDALLVEVARRLVAVAPRGACVARLGGDEFAMLVPGAADAEARALAAAVAEALLPPVITDGRELVVRGSVGVALASVAGPGADSLLDAADDAMYEAKRHRLATPVVFHPRLRTDDIDRLALTAALVHAIDHDELEVHYQPIVELATGEPVAFEALVRWRRDDGLAAPAVFIPHAEETGLIVPIGRFVLGRACAEAARWRVADGRIVPVAVNVSARQLRDDGFVDEVAGALAAARLPAEALTLELTETVLMDDAELAVARLRALAELGVRIAIDDFGTGYSSLAYLQELPVHRIKLARPFVARLGCGDRDARITRVALEMARHLDLEAVAEGIESAAQRDLLLELGCRLGQGFHFAPPLPAAEVAALLAGRASAA